MKRIGRVLASVWLFMRKGWRRVRLNIMRFAFPRHGRNFIFDPDGYYTHQTIQIGDDVFIGSGAQLSAPKSKIVIGNKAMIGPNVTILGGDHNTTEIGKFMFDVKDKLPENDAPVIIEDDVWVGAGVTILKGVRIGRGSIVAAGALVTKDVAPYAIVGGIPSRVLRYRFPPETIVAHEKLLYEPADRLAIDTLIAIQTNSTPSPVSK